jgi:pimeloyl-ACP methyl ester carboxylesterase
VPALVVHGEEDGVVLPAAAEEHADLLPDAETSWYPEVGHSPFFEAPERFNRELRSFVEGL